jgi:hypothetical protein
MGFTRAPAGLPARIELIHQQQPYMRRAAQRRGRGNGRSTLAAALHAAHTAGAQIASAQNGSAPRNEINAN